MSASSRSMSLADRRARADHLDLGVVGRPVRVAEQVRALLAQRQQLGQHRAVLRVRDAQVLAREGAAHGRVVRVGAHGDQVGVLGGQGDEALVVGGVRREEVLGEAGELLGAHADRPRALTDVAGELEPELGAALGQRAQAVALGGGPVDPRAAEVAQHVLVQALGVRVETRGVGRAERLPELAVEPALGREVLGGLGALLGALAERRRRVDLGEQVRRGGRLAERDVGRVPRSRTSAALRVVPSLSVARCVRASSSAASIVVVRKSVHPASSAGSVRGSSVMRRNLPARTHAWPAHSRRRSPRFSTARSGWRASHPSLLSCHGGHPAARLGRTRV
ncbi:hypothetical protein ACFP82_00095 [Cellulomonas gelida]|uniref:hypothetical protein n=1 Tax=Cellulomonas gelida TaxID=1712 RepID=UPI00360CEAF9